MDAILYTSNTGTTAAYARLLGEATGLPVYALNDAGALKPGAEVIYLGWLMAGEVKGYKKAEGRYAVRALCGVGMGKSGSQIEDVRNRNNAPSLPVFTLQGGFDLAKLQGIYKFMMLIMKKTVGAKLSKKSDRTPEEDDMLDMLMNGGNRVSVENLAPVLDWVREQ